jgi:hypothetical protein
MAKWEVNGLFQIPSGRYLPCGLNIIHQLWWRFMPGVIINVKWPAGNIIVDDKDPRWCDLGGAVCVDLGFSADPNDHYRPWMEKNIGKQGWDWDWGMANMDATENRLTIKIRRKYQDYAIIAKLQWS